MQNNIILSVLFTLAFVVCYLSFTAKAISSDPSSHGSSSVAFNSDGKGEVMVSCNGKVYKGEGIATCTSSASFYGGRSSSSLLFVASSMMFGVYHILY